MVYTQNNIVEKIAKFIQNSKENISKGDDVAEGAQQDK